MIEIAPCKGYFAHPFEDMQLHLLCLPIFLPHELRGGRSSEVLLTELATLLKSQVQFSHLACLGHPLDRCVEMCDLLQVLTQHKAVMSAETGSRGQPLALARLSCTHTRAFAHG
jgi:hypothetical protein